MSESDPRLAELLRRLPAPPAELDAARRQAVIAAARQAWFRQRASRRNHLIWFAVAALITAVFAGWTLRILTEDAVVQAPVVARRDAPPEPSNAASAERSRAAPPRPEAAAAPAAGELTKRRVVEEVEADGRIVADAVAKGEALDEPLIVPAAPLVGGRPAAMRAPGAPPAEQRKAMAKADAAADGLADAKPAHAGGLAPAAAMAMEAGPPQPAAAPAAAAAAPAPAGRGRLIVARLVLEADAAGRLPAADRHATLQTALDGLVGLDDPEAKTLRLRLTAALGR